MKIRRRVHVQGATLVYGGLAMLIAIVAMQTQLNFLFWIFGVMVAGVVLSALIGGTMMGGVRIHRLDPHHGAVGEPLAVRYRLTNRRRWLAAFNVHVEEVPVRAEKVRDVRGTQPWQKVMDLCVAWVMHIAPRERAHADVEFWPRQRGRVRFDRVRIWTTFPFGIIRLSITISQPQHTLVFPRLHRLRSHVLSSLAPTGPFGMRMSAKSGNGDEYFGVREYRPGDSLRNVSWKMTARRDELLCIDRTSPSPPRLRIILNLTRQLDELRVTDSSDLARRELQERSISLAASIIHAAAAMDYEVGLTIAGTDHPQIPIRRSRWHLGRMMSALASIDLDRDPASNPIVQVSEYERSGQIIIHPDRVDLDFGRSDASHFSATQMERLTDGPLGWDPSKMPHVSETGDAPEFGMSDPTESAA